MFEDEEKTTLEGGIIGVGDDGTITGIPFEIELDEPVEDEED